MLFISHDLEVVELMCDRIAVLYLGRIVEIGRADEVSARPRHPYTRALLAASPKADPDAPKIRRLLKGDIPFAVGAPVRLRISHPLPACDERMRPCRSSVASWRYGP